MLPDLQLPLLRLLRGSREFCFRGNPDWPACSNETASETAAASAGPRLLLLALPTDNPD